MCLQCVVDAKAIIRFILSKTVSCPTGWHLYVATKDDEEWPKGYYGLLRMNNPDFVFPLKDLDNPDWDAIYDAFLCNPEIGYKFYQSCIDAGYNQDGSVEDWFIKRLILKLKEF